MKTRMAFNTYKFGRIYFFQGIPFLLDGMFYLSLLGVEFEFNYRNQSSSTLFTAFLKVIDTPRVKHFETQTDPDLNYPDNHQYFMYGQNGNIYLSHIVTKKPDFQQVSNLQCTTTDLV